MKSTLTAADINLVLNQGSLELITSVFGIDELVKSEDYYRSSAGHLFTLVTHAALDLKRVGALSKIRLSYLMAPFIGDGLDELRGEVAVAGLLHDSSGRNLEDFVENLPIKPNPEMHNEELLFLRRVIDVKLKPFLTVVEKEDAF